MPDKIMFNLETVEREGSRPEPYVVALPGGEKMTLIDPQELPSDDLLSVDSENPVVLMRMCVADEDKKKLPLLLQIPAWKLNLLMEDFQRHYGLDKLGNARGSRGW